MGAGFFHQAIVWPGAPTDTATASYLLTGETDGFAINAISASQTPAYVGASYAGSVSVKDTGTPANTLTNVALDASNLTQSGTSPKMVLWNSSPYVRWTPHNLVPASQDIAGVEWNISNATETANDTTAPDGTTTGYKWTGTNATTAYLRSANLITTVADGVYTVSFYAKKSSQDWINIDAADAAAYNHAWKFFFNISTGAIGTSASGAGTNIVGISSSITDAGNGWWRCSATFSNAGTTTFFYIISCNADNDQNSRTGTFWLWGVQLNRGYQATSYIVTTSAARIGIPQAYDTAASKYGILVEPAATNLALQSEDFATTWNAPGGAGLTISSNSTAAPDGATTADTLTSADGGDYIEQIIGTLSTGTNYTWSVYGKYSNTQYLQITASDNTANAVKKWFDVQNGSVHATTTTVGGGSLTSATITSIGNGWYRCTLTFQSSAWAADVRMLVTMARSATAEDNQTNDAIYAWGAQAELGSVATSYIPTLGSTVTRAKDVVAAALSTMPSMDAAATMVVHWKSLGAGYLCSLYEPAADDLSVYDNGVGAGNTEWYNGVDVDISRTSVTSGVNKIASAYTTNDCASVLNGGAAGTDAAVAAMTFTTLGLGQKDDGSGNTNSYIYAVILLPRRANNTELQTLST